MKLVLNATSNLHAANWGLGQSWTTMNLFSSLEALFFFLLTAGLLIKCSASEDAIKMVGNAQRSFGCLTEKSICEDSHQWRDHLLHILRLFSKAELGRKPQFHGSICCISVSNLQFNPSFSVCFFLFSDSIVKISPLLQTSQRSLAVRASWELACVLIANMLSSLAAYICAEHLGRGRQLEKPVSLMLISTATTVNPFLHCEGSNSPNSLSVLSWRNVWTQKAVDKHTCIYVAGLYIVSLTDWCNHTDQTKLCCSGITVGQYLHLS